MALKAGRVGVKPDQVDRYGRIVGNVLEKLYSDVPFLKKKWHEIHVSSNGTEYTMTSTLDGVVTQNSVLLIPAGYRVVGFIEGFMNMLPGEGESASAQNVAWYPTRDTNRPHISIPSRSRHFDMTVWVAVEEI